MTVDVPNSTHRHKMATSGVKLTPNCLMKGLLVLSAVYIRLVRLLVSRDSLVSVSLIVYACGVYLYTLLHPALFGL